MRSLVMKYCSINTNLSKFCVDTLYQHQCSLYERTSKENCDNFSLFLLLPLPFLSFSPDCMIEVVLSISLSHQRGRDVVLNKAKILYRTFKKLHFFFPYTKLLLTKFYRRLMMTNSRTLLHSGLEWFDFHFSGNLF